MTIAARFGRCALALCILVPSALVAQDTYPSARVDRTALVRTPDAIATFLQTLRRLDAEGAFAAGAGTAPRDDLGGLGAKAWLLGHVAPDFRCLADHGGLCPDVTGPQAHVARFLTRFRDAATPALDPAAIAAGEAPDLGPFGFAIPVLLQDQAWLEREEGMLCTPQAGGDGLPEIEAALTELADGDLLYILDRLRALMGRYNIRAEPRIDAAVLTQTEDQILFFPDPLAVVEEPRDGAPPYRWRAVLLPDGRRGFVAPEPGDVLDAGGMAEQICYADTDAGVLIRVHVGGGD